MPESADSPYEADWAGYYDARSGRPPRPLLVEAVELFATPGHAIDLGAGAGVDVRFLLDRGWSVTAIDNSPPAVGRLEALASRAEGRLRVRRADLADDLGLELVELVHAGFSLPFCRPDRFAALWGQVEAALPSGGVFVGQMFGERDSWGRRVRRHVLPHRVRGYPLAPASLVRRPGKPDMSPAMRLLNEGGGSGRGKRATPRVRRARTWVEPRTARRYMRPAVPARLQIAGAMTSAGLPQPAHW